MYTKYFGYYEARLAILPSKGKRWHHKNKTQKGCKFIPSCSYRHSTSDGAHNWKGFFLDTIFCIKRVVHFYYYCRGILWEFLKHTLQLATVSKISQTVICLFWHNPHRNSIFLPHCDDDSLLIFAVQPRTYCNIT